MTNQTFQHLAVMGEERTLTQALAAIGIHHTHSDHHGCRVLWHGSERIGSFGLERAWRFVRRAGLRLALEQFS